MRFLFLRSPRVWYTLAVLCLAMLPALAVRAQLHRMGGGAPEPLDRAEQWAQATVTGDYTTTRELATFGGLQYAMWQGNNENARARGALHAYTVASEEMRGESIVFCIEYAGAYTSSVHVSKGGAIVSASSPRPGACPLPAHLEPAGDRGIAGGN